MQYVLFLCTGNYFRSRFAEILFNDLAKREGIDWRAESRGLALERLFENAGPISQHTLAALEKFRIEHGLHRAPQTASPQDFVRASLVIALKEAEHRPLMEERYAAYASRVSYWHVHDTDQADPQEALSEVHRLVEKLVADLKG